MSPYKPRPDMLDGHDAVTELTREAERLGMYRVPGEATVHPSHYPDAGGEDLLALLLRDNVPYAEGAIIKYVYRWRRKGGLDDLYKAQEVLARLIKANYDGATT